MSSAQHTRTALVSIACAVVLQKKHARSCRRKH